MLKRLSGLRIVVRPGSPVNKILIKGTREPLYLVAAVGLRGSAFGNATQDAAETIAGAGFAVRLSGFDFGIAYRRGPPV
jgi:hypothetical protein